jgi:hypothetical protein
LIQSSSIEKKLVTNELFFGFTLLLQLNVGLISSIYLDSIISKIFYWLRLMRSSSTYLLHLIPFWFSTSIIDPYFLTVRNFISLPKAEPTLFKAPASQAQRVFSEPSVADEAVAVATPSSSYLSRFSWSCICAAAAPSVCATVCMWLAAAGCTADASASGNTVSLLIAQLISPPAGWLGFLDPQP